MELDRYLAALRGLLDARRLVALGIVIGSIAITEWLATRSLRALALDGVLVVSFVLVAPGAYRVLAPRGGLGLVGFAALGVGVVSLVAWLAAPRWTYVIDPGSIALLVVLFLVGGWGLGRDLELSERAARLSIEAERSKVE
ncbi:MAG: hypothetical protein K1X94_29790, partial [Sandaracinaceae bacterium]|nr:hypothetical protein [Sandaracinaceae bacterium]